MRSRAARATQAPISAKLKKAILAIAIGVGGCLVFGGLLYLNNLYRNSRDGELVLLAPIDAPLSASLDGRAITLAPGETHRVNVAHGEHTLEVTAPLPLTRRFTIDSGRNPRVVPVRDTECYAELDVTLSHYGDGARPPPTVARTTRQTDVWVLTAGTAVNESELPAERSDRVNGHGEVTRVQLVQLWRPIPCAIAEDHAAILSALGY